MPTPLETAAAEIQQAIRANDDDQAVKALGSLLIVALGSLERIAVSLEALAARDR